MDIKVFTEKQDFVDNNAKINTINFTNDDLVNDFLNKNVTLEGLIEKRIYNNKV